MKKKFFPLLSLLLICGLTGCNGIKNSMRLSEKNSPWNPLHRLTKEQANEQESAWETLQRLTDRTKADEEPVKPVTMTAIWKDSVYEQVGIPTVKGFGGRFYFYDEDSRAVKADGELIVYGFDESVKNKTESTADKKFVFRSEEFQQHFSESGIGASYSVWIPWEKVGGFRKSITLIPMFRLADGTVLKSGQSINILPGKVPDQRNSETSKKMPYRVLGSSPAINAHADFETGLNQSTFPDQGVARAGFEAANESDGRIRTSTFRLTKNLSNRLARPRPQESPTGRKTAQTEGQTEPTGPGGVVPESDSESKQGADEKPAKSINSDRSLQSPARSTFGQPGAY